MCQRSDALPANASYPSIALRVAIDTTTATPVTNTVTVGGGGDNTPGNNTASDPTIIGDVKLPVLRDCKDGEQVSPAPG